MRNDEQTSIPENTRHKMGIRPCRDDTNLKEKMSAWKKTYRSLEFEKCLYEYKTEQGISASN